MDYTPSIETVYQAINALYHNPDPSVKEKASFWLEELQRSMYAWEVSNELLQRKMDLESCYFAAQTMRTKIQCAFHELPVTSHQSLRDSLLGHISHITQETNQTIVTQLCLALADLALQMENWKGAVQELISRFGGNPQLIHALLEILTVLPEEVNSRSLRLGSNRRDEMGKEFNLGAPLVMELLNSCTEAYCTDPRAVNKVMRCLGSWFSVGAIPTADLAQSKLLLTVFHALLDPSTPSMIHEAAADCICSSLLYIEQDIQLHSSLAQVLCHGVLSCVEAYHRSVAEEDVDKSINYCRIFTELGEALIENIINSPGEGLGDFKMLEIILTCVDHHDYEVAEITFNFWYRFSEILYNKNCDERNEVFKTFVDRLITSLCRHCEMDPDHEGIPDEDDFFDFRVRVSELIRDVVFLVGSSNCFRQMFKKLKDQSPDTTWDASEAALFIMTAVAKNILPDENEVVPHVLDAILNLPDTTHEAVRYTSIQLVGELADWIQTHPAKLDPVLNFLQYGLQQKSLATVSANALQNICSTCRDQMINHFDGLLNIIHAMDSFDITNKAAVELLKGASITLARMPHEKISEGMAQLCSSQIVPFSQVLAGTYNHKDTSKSDPVMWLDRLSAIFRHVAPISTNGQIHPCKEAIQNTWPVLSEACNKFQSDVRVTERCCRCIRFAIRCLGKESAPLVEPLVQQIVTLYQSHQHSCFLYLGSILVDEYGSEPGCIQGLLNMLHAFCGPTFRVLEETNGLRNHPDTVDDMFRLCTRFIQRAPLAFLQGQAIKSVILCSLAACNLDHREANGSVTKFLYDLIRSGRIKDEAEDFELRNSLVRSLLTEFGQDFVKNLINAAVFYVRSFMQADLADVLHELMIFDRPLVCRWLETTLKTLPVQGSGGTIAVTHKQLADFHKSVTSAENEKQVRSTLQEFCRLFR